MKKHMKKRRTKGQAPMIHRGYMTPFTWKTPKQVMMINGVNIYGGPIYDVITIPNLSLIIDLSDTKKEERVLVTGNAVAKHELSECLFAQRVPILYIGWVDGTAHTLTTSWWETLISDIEVLPEGSSVAVCCSGGTGRTGTALAVLAGLSDQLGPDDLDPVTWVRAHYYIDAVETDEQVSYVESVTGFPAVSDPSGGLFAPRTVPHKMQGTDAQVVLHPPGTVNDLLEVPASVGASDYTGS